MATSPIRIKDLAPNRPGSIKGSKSVPQDIVISKPVDKSSPVLSQS